MLVRIARIVKAELNTYRDSLIYVELVTFVGCVLATLFQSKIITQSEERQIRKYLDET
jgi:hypothetical protein